VPGDVALEETATGPLSLSLTGAVIPFDGGFTAH
jgi:hypothetical protein